MIDKVRAAMAEMEARGLNPSVRSVRDAVGGGSHTDIGKAVRQVNEERDRLRTVREELPQPLADKASIMSLEYWLMAQEVANRAVEDVQRGCAHRIADAQSQATAALRDLDDAEARINVLVEQACEREADNRHLETTARALGERAQMSEARIATLEGELRARDDYATRRDRELELAYGSIDRMAIALGSKTAADNAHTQNLAKPQLAVPTGAHEQVEEPSNLLHLVEDVMKQAPAETPFTAAEILALLPSCPTASQRRVYKLLHSRSAAGGMFVKLGEGRFSLRSFSGSAESG